MIELKTFKDFLCLTKKVLVVLGYNICHTVAVQTFRKFNAVVDSHGNYSNVVQKNGTFVVFRLAV